jgi:hypothetical protein
MTAGQFIVLVGAIYLAHAIPKTHAGVIGFIFLVGGIAAVNFGVLK